MRIRHGLFMVFSGAAGFDLTSRYDCNAYLLDTGDGFALFDAGAGIDPDAAVAAIAAEGLEPRDVRWLLLTHGHADHSGGAADLRERLGLQVIAAPATARMVAGGDTAGISLDRAIAAGVYPADFSYRACAIDQITEPGESFGLGAVVIETIPAAGHSHDHVCFRVMQGEVSLLVSGDALFAGGRVIWQDIPDCSVSETCDTIRRLAAMRFDTLLPGHGIFALQRGQSHAASALGRLERLLAPEAFA